MIQSINDFENAFFIGVAGTGMSAIAQYLAGIGKSISGSDRYFKPGEANDTKTKLEAGGITCFMQDGSGITVNTQLVVVSTAVEDTVPEVQKAKQLNIPIVKRSELLAIIATSKKTIAVGGTSGKSTTSAMIFDILQQAGMQPSVISGAGLVSLIKEGKIGNAHAGAGEWLVIEADESDGSIVQYHPAIGLLLNVDKDHKEIDVLMEVFEVFQKNSERFIVNQSHPLAKQLSVSSENDFSHGNEAAPYKATHFKQQGLHISFTINQQVFEMNVVGKHNMENALAAVTVAQQVGVPLQVAAAALKKYEG
ncbi:MAG: Mur ligase domain-containing protein, partial [Flavihumibacter sp.]|nr:Mur ligase domain-containing protein [Flavihumibacter sp.]